MVRAVLIRFGLVARPASAPGLLAGPAEPLTLPAGLLLLAVQPLLQLVGLLASPVQTLLFAVDLLLLAVERLPGPVGLLAVAIGLLALAVSLLALAVSLLPLPASGLTFAPAIRRAVRDALRVRCARVATAAAAFPFRHPASRFLTRLTLVHRTV